MPARLSVKFSIAQENPDPRRVLSNLCVSQMQKDLIRNLNIGAPIEIHSKKLDGK